ncbi:DUF4148 domain-containing protein [Noviherbaspirillum sp. CPCC 100848]|uniref:DUF4148 domain-containing protein n=1 Tax=Noviherbaspirillum album TaxID=3080276 RepID=A0ABU6J641_9BURK|nr:DUF4148 domain-containing protein [Noviherbaspirillum sp. CPCC 100848]MEC4718893.1 DUF4148 domain-containing protein [Noviherbaspirillum sp. CPCC 100848]
MNIKMTAVALAIIATSSAAFAADDFVDYTNVPSAKTRAEVRAELNQPSVRTAAQSPEFVEVTPIAGGKTRAEVRAELDSAHAQGLAGRQSEFVEFTQVASTRTREEVREEALQAAKASRAVPQRNGG